MCYKKYTIPMAGCYAVYEIVEILTHVKSGR